MNRLSPGFYFALTPTQLEALRAAKGDPARRRFIGELKKAHDEEWGLSLGDSWHYLQLFYPPRGHEGMPSEHFLFQGESLHKGQWSWIMVLPPENVPAMVVMLNKMDEEVFRTRFFAMDKKRFRFHGMYHHVPGWLYDQWNRESETTTILTEPQFVSVWSALQQVRAFLSKASEAGRSVVFTCNYDDGRR